MIKNNKTKENNRDNIRNKSEQKNYNIKIITNPDININNKKDFTLGKNIKLNFGNSFEEENTLNKIEDNKEENKNQIDKVENKEINKDNQNKEENKEENDEENNEGNKLNKVLEKKIKKNELSFISYTSENEKKYFKENNLPVKSINRINNKTEHDNKLLGGFIEPPIEESKIFQKPKTLRLKTEGDLFIDNINLLKITNKKAFLLQEQKDLYDLQLLKKKIRNQTININNAMKVKQDHKFKKIKTDDE